MRQRRMLAIGFFFLGIVALVLMARATQAEARVVQPSLKTVPVPEPPNLAEFVRNKTAAIQLGKALFWDIQVGSDGKTACATCHFQAGADGRTANQLNPGLAGGDTAFQTGGPNATLQAGSFPFHQLANPADPNSALLFDTNDVVGSQGVTRQQFVNLAPGSTAEECTAVADPVFSAGGANVRRTTGRNSPSAINAIFNIRNFWDGRANEEFNGVNPFGQRDPNAKVWKVVNGQVTQVKVVIPNGSLASQAVGPPLSDVEMTCLGRTFPQIGRKLLSPGIRPLGQQLVAPTDSMLGGIAASRLNPSDTGLQVAYADLIRQAFVPTFWNAPGTVTVNGTEFSQLEANFALFFGLAIQLYEATLVSDDTPFDRFADGDLAALTPEQQEGLALFQGPGLCATCHVLPEFTSVTARHVAIDGRLERMLMADGGVAVYDVGFYNIGVRPTAEDIGGGGLDPFGNPLSDTLFMQQQKIPFPILGRPLDNLPPGTLLPNERAAVMGSFKTPGLRNVELTGPYFHNGGYRTLRETIEFYNRGGDFAAQNRNMLAPNVKALNLTEQQINALVAFMVGLTDERVRWQRAPFDHPALCVPNGHDRPGGGQAKDLMVCLPAVGAGGATAPFQPFLVASAATPTVTTSRPGGFFNAPQTVILTPDQPATIFYTTDGSDPLSSGTRLTYGTPIAIAATTTLKYVGVIPGGKQSATATEVYTIITTAPQVSATPPGGAYTTPQTVTLNSTAPGTIYYTLDGTAPSTASASIAAGATVTISAQGTTTLQFFAVDRAGNRSGVMALTYTIQPPPAPPAPAPPPPSVTPSWADWANQGGVLRDAPAAATLNGQVYLFARGTDNALYVKSSGDGVTWTAWRSLGGILTAAPAATDHNGVLYVFAKGSDNALYVQSSPDGAGWSGWRPLGGLLTAPPAATSVNGVLNVFAKGSDNALYLKSSSDGLRWTDWSNLGGLLTAAPAATSFQGQVWVFAKGSDNALYEKHSADGVNFTTWRNLGGVLTAAPAAASYTPLGGVETLYLFATGTDSALYERHTSDGRAFTEWQSLGGQLVGPPAAVGATGRLYAVVRWRDDTLRERHTLP